jgi:hypothetical protein
MGSGGRTSRPARSSVTTIGACLRIALGTLCFTVLVRVSLAVRRRLWATSFGSRTISRESLLLLQDSALIWLSIPRTTSPSVLAPSLERAGWERLMTQQGKPSSPLLAQALPMQFVLER